jgi:DNA-directed RNA polymerase subunit RPC12/RpoP
MIPLTDSPDIQCPSCQHWFFRDDYFELKLGAEIQCPVCEAWLVMETEEISRRWGWGAK